MVKGKSEGASAIGVRGFLLVEARSLRFGPSLFYHLHEKYEIKHAMANIVANEDDCPESDLNEMTMDWEKGKPGKSAGWWVNSQEQRRVNSEER